MIIDYKQPAYTEWGKTKEGTRVKLRPGTQEIPDSIAIKLSETKGFKDAVRKGIIVVIKPASKVVKAEDEGDEDGHDPLEGLSVDEALAYVEGLADLAELERVITTAALPGNKKEKASIVKAAKLRKQDILGKLKAEDEGDEDEE